MKIIWSHSQLVYFSPNSSYLFPFPSQTNKLWQGIERNGDEYAVVHVEPSKKRRFKRDLNYHLLTDDLNK